MHHLLALRKKPQVSRGIPVSLGHRVAASGERIPFVTSKFGSILPTGVRHWFYKLASVLSQLVTSALEGRKEGFSGVKMASDLHGPWALDDFERPNRKCNELLT
jgi:hypothetical protein